jgi:hypothetical protein
VAKRNFAKRHRHTGKISIDDLPHDFEESSEGDELSSSERGGAGIKRPKHKKAAEAQPVVQSDSKNLVQWEAQELLDMLLARNVQELKSDGTTNTSGNNTHIGSEMYERLIKSKQGDWDKLLMERPRTTNNPAVMATWLLEVLRVSDVDTTPAADTSASATANTVPPTGSTRKGISTAKVPGLKKNKRKHVAEAEKPQNKIEENTKPKVKPNKEDMYSLGRSPAIAVVEHNGNSKPLVDKEQEGNEDTELEEEESQESQKDLASTADDSSTSSEDSVDLRASKKART